MPEFYQIKGLGGGFDGLIVEGIGANNIWFYVKRFHRPNDIMGDRIRTFELHEEICLPLCVLVPAEDPRQRHFASNNPWGECISECEFLKDGVKVCYAQFREKLQVTLLEVDPHTRKTVRTIYADYFSDVDFVKQLIEEYLRFEDIDELIFALHRAKKNEES